MNEYTKRIMEIDMQIEELEDLKRDLMAKNSAYYIGVYRYGIDDDFTEYLVPIGFMTEAEALKWAEEHPSSEEVYYESHYFEVSKSEYHAYVRAARFRDARNMAEVALPRNYDDPLREKCCEIVSFYDDEYRKLIETFKAIRYPRWQIVISR